MTDDPFASGQTTADPYASGPATAQPYAPVPAGADLYVSAQATAAPHARRSATDDQHPADPVTSNQYPSGPAGPHPHAAVPPGSDPYTRTPAPASGDDPYGSTPTSPPYAGAPYPVSGAGHPTSGSPYGSFNSGRTNDEGSTGWVTEAGPVPASDPYGFVAPPGRRIEPSPPPERSRLLLGILAGLVAGLLIFGTAGYFAGRAGAPTPAAPTAAPTPQPSSSLGVFEQNQVAINQPDFAGTGLTALAQGWLPYVATCTRNGTPGGPALNAGEKNRVRCTLDGMSAVFVEYNTVADRDKARVKALGQAVDARSLTPGVDPAAERATPSGRVTGNYVEYAYRLPEGGTTRTVSAIWWDDAQTPVAGYLLAYWKDGVGESWEPMRDLWSRYA